MDIVDAWAQHPTARFLAEPYFDSLKRWTGQALSDIPLEHTVQAMRTAGVGKALLAAWHGPGGALISNEEVLAVSTRHPDLFSGAAGQCHCGNIRVALEWPQDCVEIAGRSRTADVRLPDRGLRFSAGGTPPVRSAGSPPSTRGACPASSA